MPQEEKYHTRRWFKENFGVDPFKMGIPFKTVRNPHYSRAAPMKLWKESDVLSLKSVEGGEEFKKRSLAGHKGFETRKANLKKWFIEEKRNPDVARTLKRLWEIGEEIGALHDEKAECRGDSPFDDYNYHCPNCEEWSRKQDELRNERGSLFRLLELLCKTDENTIQLARRYLREAEETSSSHSVSQLCKGLP